MFYTTPHGLARVPAGVDSDAGEKNGARPLVRLGRCRGREGDELRLLLKLFKSLISVRGFIGLVVVIFIIHI